MRTLWDSDRCSDSLKQCCCFSSCSSRWLLLGAAERTAGRSTLLFWVLWLLPFLVLPWLWSRRNPEETFEPPTVDGASVITDRAASEFGLAVASVLDVRRSYVRGGLTIAEGRLKTAPSIAYAQLQGLLAEQRRTPWIESVGNGVARVVGLPRTVTDVLRRRSRLRVNAMLFLATIVTTVGRGAPPRCQPLADPAQFMVGVPYATALLAIVGVHEMRHFIVARWQGVDGTWPFSFQCRWALARLAHSFRSSRLPRADGPYSMSPLPFCSTYERM